MSSSRKPRRRPSTSASATPPAMPTAVNTPCQVRRRPPKERISGSILISIVSRASRPSILSSLPLQLPPEPPYLPLEGASAFGRCDDDRLVPADARPEAQPRHIERHEQPREE